MDKKTAAYIISYLEELEIEVEPGLDDGEINQIESLFQFKFPPDLKLLWQTGHPVSGKFVNWRKGIKSEAEAEKIQNRIDWPLEGMLFDIELNNFWDDSWGQVPNTLDEKFETAKRYFRNYPKLIPIYSHRYIPDSPLVPGNPVFSVFQMDIIYYGFDLLNYISNEFGYTFADASKKLKKPIREIEFWSSWVCGSFKIEQNSEKSR